MDNRKRIEGTCKYFDIYIHKYHVLLRVISFLSKNKDRCQMYAYFIEPEHELSVFSERPIAEFRASGIERYGNRWDEIPKATLFSMHTGKVYVDEAIKPYSAKDRWLFIPKRNGILVARKDFVIDMNSVSNSHHSLVEDENEFFLNFSYAKTFNGTPDYLMAKVPIDLQHIFGDMEQLATKYTA